MPEAMDFKLETLIRLPLGESGLRNICRSLYESAAAVLRIAGVVGLNSSVHRAV